MPQTIDKKKIKLALNLYPVYEALSNDIERKQALTYRLLVEERLFELLKSGHESENARMTLIKKQDEFDVKLSVGDTQVDVFSVPESNDSASSGIYSSLMGSLDD